MVSPLILRTMGCPGERKGNKRPSCSQGKTFFGELFPKCKLPVRIAVFVLVALVAATPNCPASTVGLEALYTTTISSTVTITGVAEAQKSITSANYMTVLVTIQLGNDVSLSRWQLEVVIHRDLMRISKILLQRRWSDGEQSVILVA